MPHLPPIAFHLSDSIASFQCPTCGPAIRLSFSLPHSPADRQAERQSVTCDSCQETFHAYAETILNAWVGRRGPGDEWIVIADNYYGE